MECTECPRILFTDRMAGKDDKLVLELEQTPKLPLRHFVMENNKKCER
jgi:hypothetical protein